ncbi:MAG TPA: GIY-YIG nuclease family protein [Bacteroidales bacterium]|nr:GIY-YIG nuclease family protein [Bacteroidales bacterium]
MKVKYYTYVLLSLKSQKTYVGQTHDLEERVKAHNEGRSSYTRGRGPWELVYFEEFFTRAEAMEREKYFKTGKGREFLKDKIEVHWSD